MKNYNWKKFMIFMVTCTLIGAIAGVATGILSERTNLTAFCNLLKSIMPSLFIISFILGCVGLGSYFYFNYKIRKEHYSDEEGSFYEKNDKIIAVMLTCSTLCAIVNFTAFGLNLLNLNFISSLFLVNVALSFLGEVAYISLVKKVRPELNADPLDNDFKKNYFDKLDECEKYKTGKASFKTISVMIPIYIFLFLFCYLLTSILEISPIICLPIGIIWAAQTILMTYFTNKES